MIIILSENYRDIYLRPGDSIELVYDESTDEGRMVHHVLIKENVSREIHFDYYFTFCFADWSGSCIGPNIMGFFGKKDKLPDEFRNAYRIGELSQLQLTNFLATCPASIRKIP